MVIIDYLHSGGDGMRQLPCPADNLNLETAASRGTRASLSRDLARDKGIPFHTENVLGGHACSHRSFDTKPATPAHCHDEPPGGGEVNRRLLGVDSRVIRPYMVIIDQSGRGESTPLRR